MHFDQCQEGVTLFCAKLRPKRKNLCHQTLRLPSNCCDSLSRLVCSPTGHIILVSQISRLHSFASRHTLYSHITLVVRTTKHKLREATTYIDQLCRLNKCYGWTLCQARFWMGYVTISIKRALKLSGYLLNYYLLSRPLIWQKVTWRSSAL
jgi:hypothetical protein